MIKYYKEQLEISLLRRLQSNKLYGGSVFKNCSSNIDDYDLIYFYLDYFRLMHFGDQLFFKPLFKQLKYAGFPVLARPSKSLEFLFPNNENIAYKEQKTLFITTIYLLPHLKKLFGREIHYFLFDTASMSIDRSITNYFVDVFSDYFSLSHVLQPVSSEDFLDYLLPENKKILISNNKYIIFSNYLDSGRYRLFPKDKKLLLEQLKKNNSKSTIVHIGSENDRSKDLQNYSNITDIDLRGKTTIMDLFYLFSTYSIEKIYCFDTIILHISNIFNHPANVVFRHFFKSGENEQKRNAYLSLYKKDTSMLSIIN